MYLGGLFDVKVFTLYNIAIFWAPCEIVKEW